MGITVDNMWKTRRFYARLIHIIDMVLDKRLRSTAKGERLWPYSSPIRRLAFMAALCLPLGIPAAVAKENITQADYLKLYAHSRIINEKQYICFKNIIFKESRWNPKAHNGSHYGLGQMKSKWYKNLDPYRQIDETIKYIRNRHHSMCNAWAFHERKDYY